MSNLGNLAAGSAMTMVWTNSLPTTLAAIASAFTIIYLGIQIFITLEKWLNKKEPPE